MTLYEAAGLAALALWLVEGVTRLRRHIAYRRGVQVMPQQGRTFYVPEDDGTAEDQFGGMGSQGSYFDDGAENAAAYPGAYYGHRQMGGGGVDAERFVRLQDQDNETS